jgi:hypothetical protein
MENLPNYEDFINEQLNESMKDPDLKVGKSITIEMDDQDGDFNAGEYKIIGLTRGGVILSGMGKNKLEVSFGALKDAKYTVN